jgi:hypothetical protein
MLAQTIKTFHKIKVPLATLKVSVEFHFFKKLLSDLLHFYRSESDLPYFFGRSDQKIIDVSVHIPTFLLAK